MRICIQRIVYLNQKSQLHARKCFFSTTNKNNERKTLKIFDKEYDVDDWTNINESIKSKLERKLLLQKYHPLNHLANKIKHFFYKNYLNRSGTTQFSIYDNFNPVVSVEQNFDRFK